MSQHKSHSQSENCIFCSIANRTFESDGIFWEDNNHMAFLSIEPNTPGFTVVIPKDHYPSDVLKMPNEKLSEFIAAAKEVAKVLENHYENVGRVGVIMEGTGVNHAHIKLIPMHGTGFFKQGEFRSIPVEQNHWFDSYEGWLSSAGGPMVPHEQLAELAARLRKTANEISEKTS
jgi:histidine triad (HIT) family protein